jgi:sugar-specific transcriptional regulator TrmB
MAENNHNQNLYTSLEELGLTVQEINLYSISLKLGPSSISEIAKNMQISRPNVYKVIRSLENHGLARFSDKNKYARNFMVESPGIILEKLRAKKKRIEEINNGFISVLPEFLASYHQGESSTKIKVLQGKELYLKTYYQILEEEKREIQYFGSAEDFINFISPHEEDRWRKLRIKKNIPIKVLLLPSETSNQIKNLDDSELRQTKILKGFWPFTTSFQLFSNKVIIWQPKAPLAIFIEDQYIIEMLKSMFYKFWEIN